MIDFNQGLAFNARQEIRCIYRFYIIFRSFGVAFPAGIYLPKVNNRNTRARFEICSKLPIKTSDRSQ